MRRGKLLRDYADEKSCLIFGPDTPTTNPYNPSAPLNNADAEARGGQAAPLHYKIIQS